MHSGAGSGLTTVLLVWAIGAVVQTVTVLGGWDAGAVWAAKSIALLLWKVSQRKRRMTNRNQACAHWGWGDTPGQPQGYLTIARNITNVVTVWFRLQKYHLLTGLKIKWCRYKATTCTQHKHTCYLTPWQMANPRHAHLSGPDESVSSVRWDTTQVEETEEVLYTKTYMLEIKSGEHEKHKIQSNIHAIWCEYNTTRIQVKFERKCTKIFRKHLQSQFIMKTERKLGRGKEKFLLNMFLYFFFHLEPHYLFKAEGFNYFYKAKL